MELKKLQERLRRLRSHRLNEKIETIKGEEQRKEIVEYLAELIDAFMVSPECVIVRKLLNATIASRPMVVVEGQGGIWLCGKCFQEEVNGVLKDLTSEQLAEKLIRFHLVDKRAFPDEKGAKKTFDLFLKDFALQVDRRFGD